MTPEVMARAFEPFFTTKIVGQGTGLGLSQVYGFVKQSGGHIKIYTEIGQGTTVKIYLPISTAAGAEELQDFDSPVGLPGETVLVVEDDEDVRSYIVGVLHDLRYRVSHAPNGEAALRLLDRFDGNVDLLLTDVVMPGMNGRELAEEVKRRYPTVRILYMTGYSRNAIVHQGRLDPGVDMIPKPITRRTLAEGVRKIFDRA
jgi:CheY-like chemotaxis protein